MPKFKNGLSDKQRMFVQEYLVDLNATQAAIRAGYSAKTAGQIGEQHLKKLEIANAIQAEMDKRAEKVGITAEKVLESIERIAKLAEGDKEYQAALKGQELLGKHLKLFTEKHEHGGNMNVINRISIEVVR